MILLQNQINFKKICEDANNTECQKIVSILEIELSRANLAGAAIIGLSAPQIGIQKKVAIIRINKFELDLVNPKIIKYFDKDIFHNESCISYPNLSINTERYKEIVVENSFVYPKKFIATGIVSVAIQHQIDFLHLKKFTDRALKNV